MTDIVERLRFTQANGLFDAVRCEKAVSFTEAADTIEQLRARVAELEGVRSHLREVSKAVTSLTIGAGSEYFAKVGDEFYICPNAIRDRIGGMLNDGHNARRELAKARREIAAIRERTDGR